MLERSKRETPNWEANRDRQNDQIEVPTTDLWTVAFYFVTKS
jgi:hypothetical protein